MKKWITVLVSVGMVIVGVSVIRLIYKGKTSANSTAMVRVASPVFGELTEFISASGQIEPKRKVEIRSRISAQIVQLPCKAGDWVVQGDPRHNPPIAPSVLMRLDAKDIEAELKAARIRRDARAARITVSQIELEARKAGIEGQRAVLEQSETELRRKKSLLKSQDVSQSDVDQQQSKVDNLRAQLISSEQGLKAAELGLVASNRDLEAADADIMQIEEKLSYTTITSPMDGIITKLNADVGEMATGSLYNPGPVLAEVADLSQMVLVAQVDEADIINIRVGQKAKVYIQAWPDRIFKGKVVSKALALTQKQTGEKYFEVEVLLDNKNREMYSGLTADADIEIQTYKDILKIPSQALLVHELDLLPKNIRETSPEVDPSKILIPVVYRYIDGRAIVTPVVFGQSDETHTIISSGIAPDDEIIIGPYKVLERLRHMRKVKKEKDMTADEAQASLDKLNRSGSASEEGNAQIRIGVSGGRR